MSFRPKHRNRDKKVRAKGRGDWTMPGFNYMGPGNVMDDAPPTNRDDFQAQKHDEQYTEYLKKGEDPYWNWNDADEEFIENVGETWTGTAAKKIFQGKRALSKLHALGHIRSTRHNHMVNWGNTDTVKERQRKEREAIEKYKQKQREEAAKKEQEKKRPAEGDANTNSSKEQKTGDGEAGSSGNTENATNLMRSSATGRTDGSETSVDPVRHEVLRPFAKTMNCIMPFYRAGGLATIVDNTTNVVAFSIRLNSIYDVVTASTFSRDPTAAAATADGSPEKPMLMNYWSSIYRYWTVTRCEYKVTFYATARDDESVFDVWTYHHGQQSPPLFSTDAGSAKLPSYMRKLHRNCHMKKLYPRPKNSTEIGAFQQPCVIQGVYEPGNYTVQNDVAEDEFKETWHKPTEVPSLTENATFIVQRSDLTPTSTVNATLAYEISIVYHVQWKDRKAIYEYPLTGDDLAVVTDYAEQAI